ncbi:uncharacterized protein LOC102361825 [Latimeria chalumnae]|uniref:uncharacterized protein LOC102361825 n=1 Tax=Latimeria chalumnae TaxID=7897 RepID=UPI00313CF731
MYQTNFFFSPFLGLTKKITKAGNKSGFQILKRWSHSISNHMYWCASTSGGDEELVVHKWLPIMNHVANIHTGHGTRFPACKRGDIGERSWIEEGSRQHKYLEDIICNKRLVNYVKRLSPSHQTYLLESFHRGICLSAPKFVHYHHESMKARLQLAALYHNENCNRKQRQRINGGLYWSVSYPKSKHGGHVLKAVKEKCSYGP